MFNEIRKKFLEIKKYEMKYKITPVEKFGTNEKDNGWNGMIGELANGVRMTDKRPAGAF